MPSPIDGTFDDCQALVKAMFNDLAFRDRVQAGRRQLHQLGARRWPRSATTSRPPRRSAPRTGRCSFAVPTGNFGDIFAGYAATAHGAARSSGCRSPPTTTTSSTAPVPAASTRCAAWSPPPRRPWTSRSPPTSSATCSRPSGRDAAWVRARWAAWRERVASSSAQALEPMRENFAAASASEAEVADCIRRVQAASGYLLDPHTACGVVARRDRTLGSQRSAAHRARHRPSRQVPGRACRRSPASAPPCRRGSPR